MRVLDLTLALAGPTCGRLLGEFGGDVIKINAPKSGGMSGYLNRGKRSVLLDVESVEGQQLFWKLAETADVILENFSPGTAERLGIGYEEVKARNPNVIYASVSCYGRGGPWESGRGWERQGQAVAGIMERTGKIPAILGPYNLIDIGTGVLSTFTIGLGVYHRLVNGQGQHVQASLAQTATLHQAPFMFDFKGFVPNEPRYYEAFGLGPLQRFYHAGDRWFFLAATKGNAARLASVEGLQAVNLEDEGSFEAAFVKQPASVWVERLRAAGVSAQEVVPLADLMVDPFVRAQGLSVTQVSEEAGEVTMPGPSIKFSGTPMRVGSAARKTGADFESVLVEAGILEARERLEKAWALQTTDLPSAWGAGGG
jgi:crotonobetainyl-CoA:carnitine CoA-transferase CaiB-like acyl-CoA transferase